MTNEKTTTTPTPTPTAKPQMDAWAMAVSIMVGLWKAEDVAEAELVANQKAAGQNPFAAGVQSSVILLRIVRGTIQSLEYDLNQQARSCGLTMPKRGPAK